MPDGSITFNIGHSGAGRGRTGNVSRAAAGGKLRAVQFSESDSGCDQASKLKSELMQRAYRRHSGTNVSKLLEMATMTYLTSKEIEGGKR
jgi:hypothetical protein